MNGLRVKSSIDTSSIVISINIHISHHHHIKEENGRRRGSFLSLSFWLVVVVDQVVVKIMSLKRREKDRWIVSRPYIEGVEWQ